MFTLDVDVWESFFFNIESTSWLVIQMMITTSQSNFPLISIGTKRTTHSHSNEHVLPSNYKTASLIHRLISFLIQETPLNYTIAYTWKPHVFCCFLYHLMLIFEISSGWWELHWWIVNRDTRTKKYVPNSKIAFTVACSIVGKYIM